MGSDEAPHWILKETHFSLAETVSSMKAEPYKTLRFLLVPGQDSLFEGGLVMLQRFLPEDNLVVSPKVHFITKICRPNAVELGRGYWEMSEGQRSYSTADLFCQ